MKYFQLVSFLVTMVSRLKLLRMELYVTSHFSDLMGFI